MALNYFYLVLSTVGLVLLLIASIRGAKRLKQNPFLLMVGVNLLIVLILFLIFALAGIEQDARKLSSVFLFILLSTIFFSGYLQYESLIHVKPSPLRFLYFFGLLIASLTFNSLSALNFTSIKYNMILTFLIGISYVMFSIVVVIQKTKIYKYKALKIDILTKIILLLSCIILELYGQFYAFEVFVQEHPVMITMALLGATLLAFSFFFFILNYNINGKNIQVLPIKIFNIMTFNSLGEQVYNCKIQSQEGHKSRDVEQLVSKALISFSNFFKELLGMNTQLGYINAGSHRFIFKEIKDKRGTVVIVSSDINYFLNQSISRFAHVLPEKLLEDINGEKITSRIQENFDILIKKNFPYLNF
jgi:hypothetical protein